MGLIRAARGAIGGTLADQWKDFFYCEAIPADVLLTRGKRRVDPRSANKGGTENLIVSGSVIAVADGQAMAIVEQGQIVEFSAEPGEFVFDNSTEPSIFHGSLGEGIVNTFRNVGKRFTFGGQAATDQRVYYFNLKEIPENKYGTPNAIPVRIVDERIGMDIDVSIRCNGKYSYRITDPLLFYTNVSGNVRQDYHRSQLDGQLKSELLTKLQPAFARISRDGVRYSALPGYTMEIGDALNELLSEKWSALRGISISSFGIKSITATPEDEQRIKAFQDKGMLSNPGLAGGALVAAQADAMRSAASNTGGAMMGFMGMNAAMGAGSNAGNFFQMQQQQQPQAPMAPAAPAPPSAPAPTGGGWTCACNVVNTGRFCMECGSPQPAPPPAADTWACSCGNGNTGRFCSECGSPRPAANDWACNCGVTNTGRFCMECGTPRA